MARGRMVNKKISNSQRVNDLPLGAQLLFTWLIPHLDCNGCFYGSAQMIKSLVVPRKTWPKSLIEKWLVLMENSVDFESGDPKSVNEKGLAHIKTEGCFKSGHPLIKRYFVQNEQYLFMPGFVDEQIGLRRDKEKPEFPPFDGKNTESVGQTVPLSRTGSRRGREGEVEGEGETTNPRSPSSGVVVNQSIEKTLNYYQEKICLPGTIIRAETKAQLLEACETYTAESVYDAIDEACAQNQRTWPYIASILRNRQRAEDMAGLQASRGTEPEPIESQ